MMTFSINEQNEIVAFASAEEAAASSATPVDTFTNEAEWEALASTWPGARLVAIWNTLSGVTPVHKFTNQKTAIRRIWARIQSLGQPEPPKADQQADRRARVAHDAPAQAQASTKTSAAKSPTKRQRAARSAQPTAPRPGSKAAQVIALLRRKQGATLSEIVKKMRWQPHTVRGFMAGAMKKAGFDVESFKPEGGERSYRLG